MFGRRARPDSTYTRSQAHSGLPVAPDVVARGLVMSLLEAGDDATRPAPARPDAARRARRPRRAAPCAVVVADRAQVHEHDGRRLQSKTYGYYRCRFIEGAVTEARIRIYHRTAVRQQVISPKVFLNTLLHEWVHHFDFAGLRLARSPHTAGFYARLRALADALDVGFVLPPDPDDPRGARRGRAGRPPPTSTCGDRSVRSSAGCAAPSPGRWRRCLSAALVVRLLTYQSLPHNINNDEFEWGWAGQSLLLHGHPSSWSYLSGYPPGGGVMANPVTHALLPWQPRWVDHPPLFAALVGVFALAAGETAPSEVSLAVIRLVPVLCSVAAWASSTCWCAVTWAGRLPLIAAALLAFTPVAVTASALVEAEWLLAVFLLAALLLAVRRDRVGLSLLLALCLVAPLVKETGVVVAGSVCLMLLATRRWRLALEVAAAGRRAWAWWWPGVRSSTGRRSWPPRRRSSLATPRPRTRWRSS